MFLTSLIPQINRYVTVSQILVGAVQRHILHADVFPGFSRAVCDPTGRQSNSHVLVGETRRTKKHNCPIFSDFQIRIPSRLYQANKTISLVYTLSHPSPTAWVIYRHQLKNVCSTLVYQLSRLGN